MRFIKWALLISTAFIFSPQAIASCYYTAGNSYVTGTFSIGTVIVQRDTPVGSVVASTIGNVTARSNDQLYACDESWQWETLTSLFPTVSSLGNKIYNTNIPGIGIRMTDTWRNVIVPSGPRTLTINQSAGSTPFLIELIKTSTGGVGAGMLSTGTLINMKSDTSNYIFAELDLIGSNQIIPVACSITTPNITVPLDDVLASDLTAMGMTAKPRAFNVGLNCDAGARINAKLTGVQNSDSSTTGVLQLTGAGNANVATGVGIQILYNNAPVVLNNNVVLKTSAGGQETFPFTAQYYQTKTTATTGSANATATLEITYQ